jgi:Na+/melibiose symporter-like transporter
MFKYIVYIVWRLIWQVLVLTVPVTSLSSASTTTTGKNRRATTTGMRSTYLALASLASIATPVLGQTFQRLGQFLLACSILFLFSGIIFSLSYFSSGLVWSGLV